MIRHIRTLSRHKLGIRGVPKISKFLNKFQSTRLKYWLHTTHVWSDVTVVNRFE